MAERGVERARFATGVVGRLNDEWSGLGDDGAGVEACRRWADGCSALAGAVSLTEVLERVPAAPDEVLGRLLGAAADGDTLAARVVLQAMLGKVVRMAALDRWAGVDDYVAVLWCQVATYPLAARPSRVAANLALDTLKAVHRERRPEHDWAAALESVVEVAEAQPEALVASGAPPGRSLTAGVVIRRAERHRLVDPATGALLRAVYADGLSGRSVAARHGTSPGAVRVRCSRALSLLARHACVLAEAG